MALVAAPTRLGAILGAGEGAGGLKLALVTFTLDGAYPAAGGYPGITALLEAAGLDIVNKIDGILPVTERGYGWDYDPATDKLKVYMQPAAAAAGAAPEATANLAALNGLTVVCLVAYE